MNRKEYIEQLEALNSFKLLSHDLQKKLKKADDSDFEANLELLKNGDDAMGALFSEFESEVKGVEGGFANDNRKLVSKKIADDESKQSLMDSDKQKLLLDQLNFDNNIVDNQQKNDAL